MQVIRYYPIEHLYNKIIRDFGEINIDYGAIVEWVGEALEDMGIAPALEYGLSIQEVKAYMTPVPDCAITINAIMKLNVDSVEEAYNSVCESKCEIEEKAETQIQIEEPKQVHGRCCCCVEYIHTGIGDPLRTFDLIKDNFVSLSNPLKQNGLVRGVVEPVYETTYHFFKTPNIREHILDRQDRWEFRIVEGDKILFNFKDGIVMISYMRLMTDERGYPMIPSDYEYSEAIYRYIVYKLVEYLYWRGVDGYERRRIYAKQEWMEARRKAINSRLLQFSDAELANIFNYMNRMIKPNTEYEKGYGTLGYRSRFPGRDKSVK
ncbi:MAG: hypothetical protein KatS3mg083_531 [Candidatus Dojkabacteria bacterium]|nr:MAG: hypothetical protein KatS3mg083_531 [Candidatus Dojkabacteria bacterium]